MKEKHIIIPSIETFNLDNKIGEGKYGTCYRINDKEVFKKYHLVISNYEEYKQLVGIKSPSFVFPNESVYLNEYNERNFLGYLMDYIEGSKFSELPMNTDIRDLFTKIDLLEKEIRDLSMERKLSLWDLHEDNTIFTRDKKIKVLDTDLYMFEYYDLIENYKNNIKELGLFLLGFFLKDYPILNDKLREYYDLCIHNGKVKPSIILFEALEEMEKESKEKIVTFNDFCRVKRLF